MPRNAYTPLVGKVTRSGRPINAHPAEPLFFVGLLPNV